MVAEEKRALLSPLAGTVLEIGPGGGNNLAFLRPRRALDRRRAQSLLP